MARSLLIIALAHLVIAAHRDLHWVHPGCHEWLQQKGLHPSAIRSQDAYQQTMDPCRGGIQGAWKGHEPCMLLMHPPPELPQSMLNRSRVYANRHLALKGEVTRGSSVVEVGTFAGSLARFMLHRLRPSQLAVIDVDEDAIGKCHNKTAARSQQIAGQRLTKVTCLLGRSEQVLATLDDASWDLIYIDSSHTYPGTCMELELAFRKITLGGLIVVNDYFTVEPPNPANQPPDFWKVYGVIHATNEFALRHKHDLEVAYYALGSQNLGDLALRRLK